MKCLSLNVLVLLILVTFGCGRVSAQGASENDPEEVASETQEIENAMQSAKTADKAAAPPASSGYTQNENSQTLEEAISTFNQQFCPPEKPIQTIDEAALISLIRAELIKRAELEKYKNMVLVNGKVYEKQKQKPDENPDPKPIPSKPGKNNLMGLIDSAAKELDGDKARGKTKGNQKPENELKLKTRKITYRDKQNELKQMEMHSPPKFPAKKKKIVGKRGKKIKDYATSIMVPKDPDAQKGDLSVFDDMPSSDAWIEDSSGQTQK